MRPRCTSGQAAVEYIAVVALVAIVFAIAGSFVLNGRAIAAATLGQLKRGLCIVEGHDCPEEHPPCTVSSRGSSDDWNVDIAVVRFGAGKVGDSSSTSRTDTSLSHSLITRISARPAGSAAT